MGIDVTLRESSWRLGISFCSRPPRFCHPLCASHLSAAGERTNLRAGHPAAATAHLYLQLDVPSLARYMTRYFAYGVTSPALYLLVKAAAEATITTNTSSTVQGAGAAMRTASASAGAGAGGSGGLVSTGASTGAGSAGDSAGSTLELLGVEAAAAVSRWLEAQAPGLPARLLRRVQDDGRGEFSLSRARANWRRLIALRDAAAPAAAAFTHLCSWDSWLHSGGAYVGILLLGAHPSQVRFWGLGKRLGGGKGSTKCT